MSAPRVDWCSWGTRGTGIDGVLEDHGADAAVWIMAAGLNRAVSLQAEKKPKLIRIAC